MHWRWGKKYGEAASGSFLHVEDETVKLVLEERRASGKSTARPPVKPRVGEAFRFTDDVSWI